MARFEVELWIDTTQTTPAARVFKTVNASDHYGAAQEARRRVRDEDPNINSAKIDTWFTRLLLD